jgi:uncharacterized membrane protein
MLDAAGTSLAVRAQRRMIRWPEESYATALWTLIAVGTAIRLVLAFTTRGNPFDLQSIQIVADALVRAPGHVYAIANHAGEVPRWPYPPGFFPFILAGKGISSVTGLAFTSVIRVPAIAADGAIAWLVQDFLGRRGHSARMRLSGAALVALGPSFAMISGFHGQIDAVAILPAVAALWVWEREESPNRAYLAGGLIGAGAAVKTVPLLMLLALAPSARSRRELLSLVGSAAALPVLAFVPFLAAAGTGWLATLKYNGAIGLGSISLVAQPSLALNWLHLDSSPASSFSLELWRESRLIAGTTLVAAGLLLWRTRARAPLGAAIVWLTVYAFGVTFFMQYMVWGLPFFMMAGFIRPVLWLELALIGPLFVIYHRVAHAWVAVVLYVVPMLLVWAALTVALGLAIRRAVNERPVRTGQATPNPYSPAGR